MIQFLKSLFRKKDTNLSIKKIIRIEADKITFNTYKVFSDQEKLIEELSFCDIEWIEVDSDLLDYSTLESCLYIKIIKNSILIDFLIVEDNHKEFVKQLFNALKIDKKHLVFLDRKQQRKVVYTKDKSTRYHEVDNSKTGIFQKK